MVTGFGGIAIIAMLAFGVGGGVSNPVAGLASNMLLRSAPALFVSLASVRYLDIASSLPPKPPAAP